MWSVVSLNPRCKLSMAKKNSKEPWDEAEIRVLFDGIGISGVAWFKSRCGRSRKAVYNKALRMYGQGGLTRGSFTLHEICETTGYNYSHIRRAQAALNQKWKRLGPRGAHLVTEEQLRDILEWLKHDFWSKSKKLYGCQWCTTTTRPHVGRGLCSRCYYRHIYLCERLGLPVSGLKQIALLRKALRQDCANLEAHGTFIQEAMARLQSGLALSENDLERVLVVSGHEP